MRTKALITSLNKAKKDLELFRKELPSDDLYITVHCICLDTIKELQEVAKEIPQTLADARKEAKKEKNK